MPVNRPPDSYQNFESKWKRCRDCREGSDAVKAAGFDYLPPLSSHETGSRGRSEYDAYRMRALFYNAMARTVQGVAGVIFQKAPTFILTPQIEGHEQDVTLAEESGEMFALKVTEEILTTGRYGVLVEMSAPGQAIEPRPYWTGYSAENIISVSTSRRNGEQVLTRVVLKESFVENGPDDEFEENVVDQYRVLSLGDEDDDGRFYRQTIWREEHESKTWIPSEQFVPMRRNKPLDFIPFVIIGPASVAPTPIPKPPLLDLVEVLLSHYRNSADLQHGLHKVALPQPWVAGIQGSATDDNSISIGPSVVWMLDANGRAGMLEFTGAGLGAIPNEPTRLAVAYGDAWGQTLRRAGNGRNCDRRPYASQWRTSIDPNDRRRNRDRTNVLLSVARMVGRHGRESARRRSRRRVKSRFLLDESFLG